MKSTTIIILLILLFYSCQNEEASDRNQNDTVEDLNNFHENRIFKIDNEVLIEEIKKYAKSYVKKENIQIDQDYEEQFVIKMQYRRHRDTIEYFLHYHASVKSVINYPPDMITYVDDILIFIYSPIHDDFSFTDEYVISTARLAYPTQFDYFVKKKKIPGSYRADLYGLKLVFVTGELLYSLKTHGSLYYLKKRKIPDRFIKQVSIDSIMENLEYEMIAKDRNEIYTLWEGNLYNKFPVIFDYPHLHFELIRDFLINIKDRPKPEISSYNNTTNKDTLLENDARYAIAILSMQELDIDKYLELAKIGAELYYNKYISQYGFVYTFSGYKTDYIKISNFEKNKQNPKVKEFINSVYNNPKTSNEFKEYIKGLNHD